MTMARTCEEMGNDLQQTRKRRKEEIISVENGINRLPDSILTRILSFLTVQEAIPSSLVCRRWKRLWVHTPSLDFTSDSNPWRCFDGTGTTAAFIDRCVSLHLRPKITSFRISILPIPNESGYRTADVRQIDSWLSFATRRGVELLHLDCAGDAVFVAELDELDNFYSLPSCLFDCHTLVSISLQCCHLNLPPNLFCFSSLQSIELNRLHVNEDELRTLISSCPLLDKLRLNLCNYQTDLRISTGSSSRLRTLEIVDCCNHRFPNLVMKIYAPTVTCLTLHRGLSMRLYWSIYLASVKNVCFDPKQLPVGYDPSTFDVGIYSQDYAEFLQHISHARKLHLCRWSIQILSVVEIQRSRLPFSSKATKLVLNMGFNKWEIPGVAYILSCCFDGLEELTVNVKDVMSTFTFDDDFLRRCDFQERFYWEVSKSSLQISFQKLKTIRLHHSREYGETEASLEDAFKKQERELEFLAFLLKKSPLLESLTIYFQRRYTETENFQHLFPEFALRLIGFQRASERAQVIMNMSC